MYFQNNRIRIRIIFGPKFLDVYEYEYYSDPNFWTNTNTNNIWTQIFGRIRVRIISDPNFWTNNIRTHIFGPIRIRIIFEFQFVAEYEYLLFEYYSNTELFAHLCPLKSRVILHIFISSKIPWDFLNVANVINL